MRYFSFKVQLITKSFNGAVFSFAIPLSGAYVAYYYVHNWLIMSAFETFFDPDNDTFFVKMELIKAKKPHMS